LPSIGGSDQPLSFLWSTVANSATVIPGGDGITVFNSFNQPSVNATGLVALRARSKGSDGGSSSGSGGAPLRGIYSRQMSTGGSLTMVFDTNTVVPQPNNATYQDSLSTFTEFPAFPRIGLDTNTIASRSQSKPVYTYTLPDGTDTKVGTSGIYAMQTGTRVTAMSQLGNVPNFGQYSVPGATPGTKFDQFPGAPAVANMDTVVFKGNYTDGVSKTGIFVRRFDAASNNVNTQVIASSDTLIPGQPAGGVKFGSTAPPSASDGYAVFVGLDNEGAPTLGGIYRAPLTAAPQSTGGSFTIPGLLGGMSFTIPGFMGGPPTLQTLVSIGDRVPGEAPGVTFTGIGEGLSFDGQFVSFWGTWGAAVRPVTLTCPVDGQKEVIAYCNSQYPNGNPVNIPVNQGFFVHDLSTGQTYPVAKTGEQYLDFTYWVFSGRPPGVGSSDSEDFEPPRWRSSAFSAVYRASTRNAPEVAFKARKPGLVPVDGIYLKSPSTSVISPVVETGSLGSLIDPLAPGNVISVGIERDALRNGWLALAVGMLDPVSSASWAGVYLTRTDGKKTQ
jgi:hypothetical protein